MSYKTFLLLLLMNLNGYFLSAQYHRATATEGQTLIFDTLPSPGKISLRTQPPPQMEGFPKGFPANPAFKNFRNVTLSDIDKDGVEEILTGINRTFYTFRADSLLWSRPLEGLAIYPPSVADINDDGIREIVQVTGGQGEKGRIYIFDPMGNDVSPWPLNFDDNWILLSPVLTDLDNDQVLEIVVNERRGGAGRVHILNIDGSPYNDNWPVTLDATPAVTPSVGDIDDDGEPDLVVYSTRSRYAFDLNGDTKAGWPTTTYPGQRYSFQSPVLVDLDGDRKLEIVGATHGDVPLFYVLDYQGQFIDNWPQLVPEDSWTFIPPTVVSIGGDFQLFMGRPLFDETDDMFYSWNQEGFFNPGFPIVKAGGLEGLISVADIDDDSDFELLFGSNLIDDDGSGFIHAYDLDGTAITDNFPIQPRGFTYLNGVNIGDVNSNGQMDLIALSYTSETITGLADSVYLNVYELDVPYRPSKVLWRTYKGSNGRDGLVMKDLTATPTDFQAQPALEIYPNPASDVLFVQWEGAELFTQYEVSINNCYGNVMQYVPLKRGANGTQELSTSQFPPGLYWLVIRSEGKLVAARKIIIQ